MRRILIMAVCGLLAVPAVALASKVDTRKASEFRAGVAKLRLKVDRQLGREVGGRDILKYGIATKRSERSARRAEVERYRGVLLRLIAPPPAPVAVASSYSVPSSTGYPSGSCGSGYRGLFQFDCSTWQSVGGSGDPAAASVEEQMRRARMLQQQRGNQPWPVCGAGGASLEQIMQCESGGRPGAVG